jgi:hypothetical protein
MTREELRGKIQTVLGPIAPETLGRSEDEIDAIVVGNPRRLQTFV